MQSELLLHREKVKRLEGQLLLCAEELKLREAQTVVAVEKAGEFANSYCLSQEEILELKRGHASMQMTLKTNDDKISKLTSRVADLLSQVFKMQGNIRVMCRIRPITAQERAHRPELTPSVLDGISSIRDYNYLYFGGVPYEFDRVFAADVSQDEVYTEVLPMIEGVMNGCRACIFAYGQTGSGKTFTMEGPAHDRGISYRAVNTLFSISEHERSKYSTEVVVSILEVYKEKVMDLLSPEGKCTPVSDPSDRISLEIRAGKDGVYVEGLGQWRASSPDEVYQLMERGLARRQVACNNINEHSSRSHLVITMKVQIDFYWQNTVCLV